MNENLLEFQTACVFKLRTRNSVRGVVRLSVRRSVGPLVRWSVTLESKTRIYEAAVGIVYV